MIKNSTRRNRLADGSPVPDVESDDKIRFTLETTGYAPEKGSLRLVLSVNGGALRAFRARVFWIAHNNGNTCLLSLAFYEGPELAEGP